MSRLQNLDTTVEQVSRRGFQDCRFTKNSSRRLTTNDYSLVSSKTYRKFTCKGWIFLLINKEIIPLQVCKLLLRKWPGLLGAINVHKINTQADCLLHLEANTPVTLAQLGLVMEYDFSLLKEQECAIQILCYLMVSPRTLSLQFNSSGMVFSEDKFGQVTKSERCRAPIFLSWAVLITLLHQLQTPTVVSTELPVSQ